MPLEGILALRTRFTVGERKSLKGKKTNTGGLKPTFFFLGIRSEVPVIFLKRAVAILSQKGGIFRKGTGFTNKRETTGRGVYQIELFGGAVLPKGIKGGGLTR